MNVRPKILYVDDEEINLMLLRINLSSKYDVITCLDGIEGLEILSKNNDIKVVVSDLRMPMMNGIEFITKAKELYPHLPYFLLTGFDMTTEIEEAIKTELIVDYLKKPFEITTIDDSFSKVLV